MCEWRLPGRLSSLAPYNHRDVGDSIGAELPIQESSSDWNLSASITGQAMSQSHVAAERDSEAALKHELFDCYSRTQPDVDRHAVALVPKSGCRGSMQSGHGQLNMFTGNCNNIIYRHSTELHKRDLRSRAPKVIRFPGAALDERSDFGYRCPSTFMHHSPFSNYLMKILSTITLTIALLTSSYAVQQPSFHTKGTPTGKPTGTLKPGEYWWHPELSPSGPLMVLVSVPEQTMHVYRNGILIGRSSISTGSQGHSTPGGVFSILGKSKEYYSKNTTTRRCPTCSGSPTPASACTRGISPATPPATAASACRLISRSCFSARRRRAGPSWWAMARSRCRTSRRAPDYCWRRRISQLQWCVRSRAMSTTGSRNAARAARSRW